MVLLLHCARRAPEGGSSAAALSRCKLARLKARASTLDARTRESCTANYFCRETLSQIPAPEARQKVAPGERSEPWVRIFDNGEPRQGRKRLFGTILHKLRGSV